ncbi:hypothetical protein IG631_24110 [Alternaria alternata]|nr:hypothetical protein IG631_24110 [Alternaria alternata]
MDRLADLDQQDSRPQLCFSLEYCAAIRLLSSMAAKQVLMRSCSSLPRDSVSTRLSFSICFAASESLILKSLKASHWPSGR